ncbi:MAG: hypothetical protein ACRCYY_02900 [Trueperaceae bacterium]
MSKAIVPLGGGIGKLLESMLENVPFELHVISIQGETRAQCQSH